MQEWEQMTFGSDIWCGKMRELNVLVACEESQRVCAAFRELGHNAYSCDVQEPSGGHPEWHIKGDVLPLLHANENGAIEFCTMDGVRRGFLKPWDLIIAHPPCTYLSNAGACRLYPKAGVLNQERYKKGVAAKEFFLCFLTADCKHIAIENPIPSKIYNLPPYSQIIQPYNFGHPYTKKTCLWLKNLPLLYPTKTVEPKGMYVNGNSAIWKKQALTGEVTGKSKSPKERSKTFEGIARAMAEQWSSYLMKEVQND